MVRRATEDAITRLEQSDSPLLDNTSIIIYDLELPAEAERLATSCVRCAQAFWEVWNSRKRIRAIRRKLDEENATRTTTHNPPTSPAVTSSSPQQDPDSPTLLPVIRAEVTATIRLVIPTDLLTKPWVMDLARDCEVGTNLRSVQGNTFRQVLLIRVWGSPYNMRRIASWAKDQGASPSWVEEPMVA